MTLSELREEVYRYSLDPLYDHLALHESGMSGDLVLVCTPATTGSSAAAVAAAIAGAALKFTRTVEVELQNAAGERHTWFSGTRNIAVGEVTVGTGVAAIRAGATTVTFVAGVGTVTIDYTGTWAAADTQTLTVTGGTILGYTVADKTSVDTLIA